MQILFWIRICGPIFNQILFQPTIPFFWSIKFSDKFPVYPVMGVKGRSNASKLLYIYITVSILFLNDTWILLYFAYKVSKVK